MMQTKFLANHCFFPFEVLYKIVVRFVFELETSFRSKKKIVVLPSSRISEYLGQSVGIDFLKISF